MRTFTTSGAALGVPGLEKVELRGAGAARLLEARGAGICGSRNVSERGLEIAMLVGKACADHGVTLIAGDARGVDDAAQVSALRHGGDVIAVLPEGLGGWKPRTTYRGFLDEDWSNFLAVSQFEDGARWQVYRAMQRNEVVIALSAVLFVVESGEDGGTFAAGESALRRKHPLYVLGDSEETLTAGSRKLVSKGGQFLHADAIDGVIASIAAGAQIEAGQQGVLL